LLAAPLASAQEPATEDEGDEGPKPAKLFEREDTLAVTIRAPWRDVTRKKKDEHPYPGEIEYTDELGNRVVLPLTVETRGIKRQEVCSFPPIRLRFEKENVKGTTFRGQKSLKMVTHCEKSSSYEQFYIVEMLIYQMYQMLTDYSFRVRPLSITYYDSERDKADDPRFAFLIEDDSDVAKRHDMKKLEIPSISYRRMEPDVAGLFGLFQYMIGNVDWASLRGPDPEECCHNVKLIAPEPLGDDDWIYVVPYDFDSAGLVDAKYAAPPDGLPIRKVTQRLYRGYCWHNENLPAARQLILDKKAEILGLVENDSRLNSKTKRDAGRYLENFFEIIEDDEEFQEEIVAECRGKSKGG
jgi:hypothetical protein